MIPQFGKQSTLHSYFQKESHPIINEVQVNNLANIDLKPWLYSWFDPWSPQLDIDEAAALKQKMVIK